ncbi:PH domain-containing protein [Gaetbulibacter saemankumensis]|uniref:hypothetical protein n=1 Tax=Gaetbulibacter saemankumensis TaxID=311208 RepID=UPI000488C786|nr:hypothetical protein [Gaetbulibacter saemankumensis]
MKTISFALLVATMLLSPIHLLYSQQMYQVHQDNVKPAKVFEYEMVARDFIEACITHNPPTKWITAVIDDFRYLYISPMDNYAELDKRPFKDMADTMGDEFGTLFNRFDACYDAHTSYVITLLEDLTYMPQGISQTQEGKNNRKFIFLYYSPDNGKALHEAMKKIKEVFASKGSNEYYRVYRSGFGTPENYLFIAISYKDQIENVVKSRANQQLLGQSGLEAFSQVLKHILRYEEYNAEMRPDLAFTPR